jgi:hypothetical protein
MLYIWLKKCTRKTFCEKLNEVIALATKRTHKKKKSKVSAARLEGLVESVKNRPIFVVDKVDDHYAVIDYIRKDTVVPMLPTRHVADLICTKYNRSESYSHAVKMHLVELIRGALRTQTEMAHYQHTAKHSKDSDIAETAVLRYLNAQGRYSGFVSSMEELV